jgi:predicted amidophosphoribosyltransferase
MAREMGIKVDNRSVRRVKNNPSQTTKRGSSRWENVDNIFVVRRPERLRGKHILIVDDVLTTGATISSCIAAIVAQVPDCTISVVALATPSYQSLR